MIGRSLLRLTLPAVLLCGTACAEPDGGPSPESRRAELLARTLMLAWETADTAAIVEIFSSQAVYDDFPNQAQYQGVQEIVGYVGHVHAWASNVVVNVGAVHAHDAGATVEWLMSGTQDRPVPGQIPVATGREFMFNGVTVLELDGDRIMRAADYIDTAPLLLQLGSRIELPGGQILEAPEGSGR